MDIRKLSYFVEVVKEQSFSYAAQKLYISQPMLSKAICQLEEEFGVMLIKRNSKSFQVTDAGKMVYQRCTKLLNYFYELEHMLDDKMDLIQGSVSISVPAVVMSLYFIPLFISIWNRYPDVHIDLFEEGSYTVLDSVIHDIVNMGIVMLPIPTQDLDLYPIIRSQCVLIVNRDHPLAGEDCVDISQLEHEKFIIFNRHFVLYDMIRQACYSRQFSPNITSQSSRTSFIINMVSQNQGITILPEPVFPVSTEHLRKIKLYPEIPWELALIIKKGSYQSSATLKVIEEIIKHFKTDGSEQ